MNFNNVTFYKSVSIWSEEVFFVERKEIIFVGRSNVGKSSILNALFNKKDFVKTSSKPGKTKLANIFLVNNKYHFTDLPGYWFAKLWKEMQEQLDWLISWYIEEKKDNIKKAVILVDSKIWPLQTDIDMYKYLLEFWIPVVIVLSKIDRISNSERKRVINLLKESFFWQDIFAISSSKKTWILEFKKYLENTLLSN